MNTRLVATIKEKFKERSDEELISIYTKNERYDYSEEAYEAIKIILGERNIEIPKQELPKHELPIFEKTKKENIKYSDRYYRLKINGYAGMVSGFVLMLFSFVVESSIMPENRMGIFNPLNFLGMFSWFWGYHSYVLRKGYGSEYTLLGIFGLIGFLIMYQKEDLGEAKKEND